MLVVRYRYNYNPKETYFYRNKKQMTQRLDVAKKFKSKRAIGYELNAQWIDWTEYFIALDEDEANRELTEDEFIDLKNVS